MSPPQVSSGGACNTQQRELRKRLLQACVWRTQRCSNTVLLCDPPSADYEVDAELGGSASSRRRQRGGSRSTANFGPLPPTGGPAWLPPGAAAAGAAAAPAGAAGLGGVPEVVATEEVEGRNVLRIKISRPPARAAPADADAAAPAAAAGGQQGEAEATNRKGSSSGGAGCPLHFLAGLAGDVATPMAQGSNLSGAAAAAAQQQDAGLAAANGAEGAGGAAAGVVLLSKKLLRVSAGRDGWRHCVLDAAMPLAALQSLLTAAAAAGLPCIPFCRMRAVR
jgi:hypothetical protein